MNQPDVSRPPIAEERVDGVALLTLDHPARRNALSAVMIAALASSLQRLAEDPAARVIVLRANGPAYCAGHDLREMAAMRQEKDGGRKALVHLFDQCSTLMAGIVRHPKPVIAQVQGPAFAAGCQLVASCDLAVASEEARFATPGVQIGLFCSTPMVALGRSVARKHAMQMLLTGDPIDARQALEYGLVSQVSAPADLENETLDLARRIADRSSGAIRHGKRAFAEQLEMPLEQAYAHTGRIMVENMLDQDAAEGIEAFLDRREPVWPSHRDSV